MTPALYISRCSKDLWAFVVFSEASYSANSGPFKEAKRALTHIQDVHTTIAHMDRSPVAIQIEAFVSVALEVHSMLPSCDVLNQHSGIPGNSCIILISCALLANMAGSP
jgi:hypothetical protein